MIELLFYTGIIALLSVWPLLLIGLLFLWNNLIRKYVIENGKSPGHGANIGWTILADASIATEIAIENKSFPWFLTVFWVIEIMIWVIPIAGFVFFATRH